MKIYPAALKLKAFHLRQQGYVYTEINKYLSATIPKSTFSHWFKGLVLTEQAKLRIYQTMIRLGAPGRAKSIHASRQKRQALISGIYKEVSSQYHALDSSTAKLILAMLYLGEGGKTGSEFIRMVNSNPNIIILFLNLFRSCFTIEEFRLRGRLQCRSDQDKAALEVFWSDLTQIPLNQFYPTYIDKRTIGVPTKRLDYKGVFSITYCSNKIFLELKFISDIISQRAQDFVTFRARGLPV